MDPQLQKTFREQLVTEYRKNAFEYLGLYKYWGEKFTRIKKEVDEYTDRIKTAEGQIAEIEAADDRHTVENRTRKTALKKDITGYEGMIERVKKPLQEIEKKCIDCQEHAVRNLETADMFVDFKVKTTEEMELDKQTRAQKVDGPAPEPVVAGAEK